MDLNQRFILNPDYHFKNDIDRIVIFSKNEVAPYSSAGWIGFIHPAQAIILALFTTVRTLKEQLDLLCNKFHFSLEKAEKIISPFIHNEEPVFTEFQSNQIAFPKNVLINIDGISPEKIAYDIKPEDLRCKTVNLKQDRMHKAPHSILFMVTNKCVTSCKYCYADKQTPYEELSTERILELIDEARKLGVMNIDVTGGEVFCRKDWNIIIKALVDAGMTPNYISTKFPVTPRIAKMLYETGYNNVVQISLDTLNDSNLSEIIGTTPGYVGKVLQGIGYLQEYGFKIQIDTILTKHNSTKEEMQALYEYARTIKNFVYWEIRTPGESIYFPKTFQEIKASRKQLEDVYSYIRKEILPTSGIKIKMNRDELDEKYRGVKCTEELFQTGTCGSLFQYLYILPDGKVGFCEKLYWHPKFIIGDLRTQSIAEVWQSEKAKELFVWKKSFYEGSKSICVNCKAFDFCHEKHRKCWVKIIQSYGTGHWDYPDPRCEFAPELINDVLYC